MMQENTDSPIAPTAPEKLTSEKQIERILTIVIIGLVLITLAGGGMMWFTGTTISGRLPLFEIKKSTEQVPNNPADTISADSEPEDAVQEVTTQENNNLVTSQAPGASPTPAPTYARPQPNLGSSSSSTTTPTPAPDEVAAPAPTPTYTISTVISNLTIGIASSGGPDARCPEGTMILGGGFTASPGAKIFESYRVGEMWRITVSNPHPFPINVQSLARCAQGLPGFIGTYFESTTIAADSLGTVSKNCPDGQTAISGGFQGNGLEIHFSAKVGNGWRVNAQNHTATAKTLTASVNCYAGGPASVTQTLQAADIPAGDEGTKEASCSSGVLAHGGFSFNSLVYDSHAADSTWKITGRNQTFATQRLRAYAYCATF